MSLEQDIMQTKPFLSTHHKLAVNLILTGSWIQLNMTRELRKFDISLEQFNVLKILKGQNGNPISIKNVSVRMIDKNSNVSRLIDKLIEKKLVEKSINEKMKREVCVTISEIGIHKIETIDKSTYFDFKCISHLNNEQAEHLNNLLDLTRS